MRWGVGVFWHGRIPAVLALDVVPFATRDEAELFYLVVSMRFSTMGGGVVKMGSAGPRLRPLVIEVEKFLGVPRPLVIEAENLS